MSYIRKISGKVPPGPICPPPLLLVQFAPPPLLLVQFAPLLLVQFAPLLLVQFAPPHLWHSLATVEHTQSSIVLTELYCGAVVGGDISCSMTNAYFSIKIGILAWKASEGRRHPWYLYWVFSSPLGVAGQIICFHRFAELFFSCVARTTFFALSAEQTKKHPLRLGFEAPADCEALSCSLFNLRLNPALPLTQFF